MQFDKSILLDDFIVEAKEHLDSVYENLSLLKEDSKNKVALETLLREIHTLKGTSRLMGFKTTEELSHSIEDVLKSFFENKIKLTNLCLQLLFLSLDALSSCIEKIESDESDDIDISKFKINLQKASNGQDYSIDNLIKFTNKVDILSETSDVEENISSVKNVKSVRIRVNKINEIIHSFDNLIIREFKIKHQLDLLKELEFKTGSFEIRKIRRQLEEDFEQLEQSVFAAQHHIFDLRMLPLDLILTPLKRNLEFESLNLNKKIKIDIPKTEVSLDKLILEPLSDVLLHLVRNALDHGIENSEERIKKGKSEFGTISIKAKTLSNKIIITVSDDGGGIDYEKIRSKAIQLMSHREKEILEMTNKQLASFLFMSGFSTMNKVSVVSGRGVGLDVVKQNIEKIKGKIQFESELGKGTSFILTLPLSLATLQGLFVRCNNMKLLIPTSYIVEIVHATDSDYIYLQDVKMLRVRDSVLPIYNLSSIIDFGNDKKKSASNMQYDSVVIVEYLERKVGIVVSEVFNTVSVVVKPLPKVFSNYEALQGIIFDENYDIVPIIHIPDVLARFNNLVTYDVKKFDVKTKIKKYKILIVDDSITTRQIEKTIFEAEGFIVDTAVDGIDALEKIKNETFDAIVTDIKMPRMNGDVFVENVRRIEEYTNVPIVVVSAVFDSKLRDDFERIGVNGFIVKSDFERGNLVSTIKELLDE